MPWLFSDVTNFRRLMAELGFGFSPMVFPWHWWAFPGPILNFWRRPPVFALSLFGFSLLISGVSLGCLVCHLCWQLTLFMRRLLQVTVLGATLIRWPCYYESFSGLRSGCSFSLPVPRSRVLGHVVSQNTGLTRAFSGCSWIVCWFQGLGSDSQGAHG